MTGRLIQTAFAPALTPLFEPVLSHSTNRLRPGRKAHAAVRRAQAYINQEYGWVVDIDLEQSLDRVNHDHPIARAARPVKDRQALKLIRSYHESGLMLNEVKIEVRQAAPEGGPISPPLAGNRLDDLDQELEKRAHPLMPYADDANIHINTQRAGAPLLAGIGRPLKRKPSLKANANKRGVDRPRSGSS